MDKYLYDPYGLGLSAMAVIIICIWICAGKCKERKMALFLAVIFVIPVFPWILNGGLYVRSKAFLPFLPLVVFLCARFFDRIADDPSRAERERFTGKALLAGCLAGTVFLLVGSRDFLGKEEHFLLLLDLVVCWAALAVSVRWKRNLSAFLAVCVMLAFCVAEILGTGDLRVSKQSAEELHDQATKEAVEFALENETQVVRAEVRGDSEYKRANLNRVWRAGQNLTTCYSSLENSAYNDFRESIGLARSTRNLLIQDAQSNPLFLRFMGVKYLIGEELAGWNYVCGAGQSGVYENGEAAPVFYLTDQTVSEEDFEKLSWQEKQIALLEAASVPDHSEKNGTIRQNILSEMEAAVAERQDENGIVSWDGSAAHIEAEKDIEGVISLERQTEEGEYVFLSFKVKNYRSTKDVSVTVNGVKNKLSSTSTEYYNENEVFHYVFSLPEGTQELTVQFGEGTYEISEIDCCAAKVDEGRNAALYQGAANLEALSSGDGFEGEIRAEEGQWLITSLPYDENFEILADGEQVEVQRVNGGFLGAEMPEGTYKVEIRYRSNGSAAGMFLSGLSVLIGSLWIVRKRKRTNKML